MKKDMGGAGPTPSGLPISSCRPRCRYGCACSCRRWENANRPATAYRPGDVVATRKGLTIEVDNNRRGGTDRVERRAHRRRCGHRPDLMIDFATLTRPPRESHWAPTCPRCSPTTRRSPPASRRPDVTFTTRSGRMPLHAPYRALIESKVADIMNGSTQPYGGANSPPRCSCRNSCRTRSRGRTSTSWRGRRAAKPARPVGGEAMALRAVFEFLERALSGVRRPDSLRRRHLCNRAKSWRRLCRERGHLARPGRRPASERAAEGPRLFKRARCPRSRERHHMPRRSEAQPR